MDLAIAHDWLLNRRGSGTIFQRVLFFVTTFPSLHSLHFFRLRVSRSCNQAASYPCVGPGPLTGCQTLLSLPAALVPEGDRRLSRPTQRYASEYQPRRRQGYSTRFRDPSCLLLSDPMRYICEPGLYQSVLARSWRGHLLRVFARRLREWDLESNEH